MFGVLRRLCLLLFVFALLYFLQALVVVGLLSAGPREAALALGSWAAFLGGLVAVLLSDSPKMRVAGLRAARRLGRTARRAWLEFSYLTFGD